MNKPLTIGITGGIGSGKSVVCRVFESLGYPVYYADDRAKILLRDNLAVRDKVVETFGEDSYKNEEPNRLYLAERVFSDEAELEKLNAIVHPAVARDFERFIVENDSYQLILKEAALLFETNSYKRLDKNVAVIAKKEIRLNRVLIRDTHRTEKQVEEIMAKQTSDGQRRKLADFLISNNGKELIIPQVMKIYQAQTGN